MGSKAPVSHEPSLSAEHSPLRKIENCIETSIRSLRCAGPGVIDVEAAKASAVIEASRHWELLPRLIR